MARPDSIPNSAVKRCIADGSASIGCARVGSRQIIFLNRNLCSGFFYTREIIKSYFRWILILTTGLSILNIQALKPGGPNKPGRLLFENP